MVSRLNVNDTVMEDNNEQFIQMDLSNFSSLHQYTPSRLKDSEDQIVFESIEDVAITGKNPQIQKESLSVRNMTDFVIVDSSPPTGNETVAGLLKLTKIPWGVKKGKIRVMGKEMAEWLTLVYDGEKLALVIALTVDDGSEIGSWLLSEPEQLKYPVKMQRNKADVTTVILNTREIETSKSTSNNWSIKNANFEIKANKNGNENWEFIIEAQGRKLARNVQLQDKYLPATFDRQTDVDGIPILRRVDGEPIVVLTDNEPFLNEIANLCDRLEVDKNLVAVPRVGNLVNMYCTRTMGKTLDGKDEVVDMPDGEIDRILMLIYLPSEEEEKQDSENPRTLAIPRVLTRTQNFNQTTGMRNQLSDDLIQEKEKRVPPGKKISHRKYHEEIRFPRTILKSRFRERDKSCMTKDEISLYEEIKWKKVKDLDDFKKKAAKKQLRKSVCKLKLEFLTVEAEVRVKEAYFSNMVYGEMMKLKFTPIGPMKIQGSGEGKTIISDQRKYYREIKSLEKNNLMKDKGK